MIKTINTYLNNVYGFEGHIRAEFGATALCLEKILCLMNAIESGEELPKVSMTHYITSRNKLKKSKLFGRIRNVQINKHNYDIGIPSFGKMGNWGDGNHRTFTHKIMQIEQQIIEIPEDDWTMRQIPEEVKTDFSDVKIISNYSLVKENKRKYNIPKELESAKRFPTNGEISDFFGERKNKKITYKEIIDTLYV